MMDVDIAFGCDVVWRLDEIKEKCNFLYDDEPVPYKEG